MSDDPNRPHDERPESERTEQPSAAPSTHRAAAEAAEEAFFAGDDERVSTSPGRAGDQADDEWGEEADPELLRLPRRRKRRHPVVAAGVIGLSIYLMVFVRQDLAYYFQPNAPAQLGDAGEVAAKGALSPNTFVSLNGAPDRKNALLLAGRVTGYDSFFRLLQTGNRIFVQHHRQRRTTEREVSYVHTGRVVRFDSLPYLRKVRDHYQRTMTTAHDLDVGAVIEAKRAGAGAKAILTRRGERVQVPDDRVVWINVSFANEWAIQFSRKHYASADKAKERLANIGLPVARDDEPSPTFYRFVVLADKAQAELLMRRLSAPDLHAGVVRREVSYTAKWREIDVEGDALLLKVKDPTFSARFVVDPDHPGALRAESSDVTRLPRAAIRYLTVAGKFEIPTDAMVVLTGEIPADYWYYLALYLILLAFIAMNVYALVGRFRGRPAGA